MPSGCQLVTDSPLDMARTRYNNQFAVAAALLSLACLVAGCGDKQLPTYPVTVTVTLPGGGPAAGVRVFFRSVDHNGISASGTADPSGKCQLTTYEENDGAVAGVHQVAVGPPAIMGDPDLPRQGPNIANRYGNFDTSRLEANVSPVQPNEVAFEVGPK
jgi:hypothetical protein